MKWSSVLPSLIFLFVLALTQSCKDNDDTVNAITDDELKAKLLETGYTNYSSDTLSADGPHTPFIFVKFNATASAALNSNNEILAGETFPEGSVIVKEIYNNKGGLLVKRYVMYKKSDDSNAAINWVWAAYTSSNAVEHSVSRKGVGCFECHSTNPNRDGVNLFDAH
jgi:hypothetical protein